MNKYLQGIGVIVLSLGMSTLTYAQGVRSDAIQTNAAACGKPLQSAAQFVFSPERARVAQQPVRLGANTLFWIDTQSAWRTAQIDTLLSELGIKALRFPGGEVADNYDWERNEVVRDADFPKEAATAAEKEDRLDFRTFLKHAKENDIEDIYFVANLEGAFMQPGDRAENIRAYARHAARWVTEVKKSGYHVKYWEIGNESYLHSAYPLTAKEYADALRVFSKEMKAADPSILIGAIGPDWPKKVGFADTMLPLKLEAYRSGILRGEAPCKKKGAACAKELNGNVNHVGPAWWAEVVKYAPDAFDFAVVHRYAFHTSPNHEEKTERQDAIAYLKVFLDKKMGREIPVSLTEWNAPGRAMPRLSEGAHAIEVTAQLLRFHRAGVQDALYWPLRMKSDQGYPLVNAKTGRRQAAYEALRLVKGFADASETLIPTNPLPSGIEVTGARYTPSGKLDIIGVNNSVNDINLVWPTRGYIKFADVAITQLSVQGEKLERASEICTDIAFNKQFATKIPAKSVVKISIKPQAN